MRHKELRLLAKEEYATHCGRASSGDRTDLLQQTILWHHLRARAARLSAFQVVVNDVLVQILSLGAADLFQLKIAGQPNTRRLLQFIGRDKLI